jgi:hypothetical protein
MTSIDKTAPKLVSASPQKGGTAIAVNQDVVLTFNEAIQLGTGNIIISNGEFIHHRRHVFQKHNRHQTFHWQRG